MTLQEIKDQYAQDRGYANFSAMFHKTIVTIYDIDEISKMYAKAKLEEAAESVGKECGVNELKAMITGTTLN